MSTCVDHIGAIHGEFFMKKPYLNKPDICELMDGAPAIWTFTLANPPYNLLSTCGATTQVMTWDEHDTALRGKTNDAKGLVRMRRRFLLSIINCHRLNGNLLSSVIRLDSGCRWCRICGIGEKSPTSVRGRGADVDIDAMWDKDLSAAGAARLVHSFLQTVNLTLPDDGAHDLRGHGDIKEILLRDGAATHTLSHHSQVGSTVDGVLVVANLQGDKGMCWIWGTASWSQEKRQRNWKVRMGQAASH